MIRFIFRTMFGITIVALSGCITSGPAEPEKWSPEDRAEAHVRLGMTYLRQNQYDTANSEFDIALAINPKSDTVFHARGLLLARLGNPEAATASFVKSISLNSSNYAAVNDYGIHLCQQNRAADGISQLKRIESNVANDQSLGTLLGLGVCYFNHRQSVLADGYLRQVLDKSPTLPQALLPMAEIRFNDKKYLSARGFLERFFGTGSISERSLFLATRVEHELEDINKANQYRRELRRRFPLSALNKQLDKILN